MTSGKVGYKNPPVHARFKQGVSGNPKGRPPGRKRKTAIECFEAALARRVTVKTANGDMRMTSLDALVQSQMQKALKGDRFATKVILDLMKRTGELDMPKAEQHVGVVVVERPALTTESWLAIAHATRLPEDPLEGLPGIDRHALRACPARGANVSPGEEDED